MTAADAALIITAVGSLVGACGSTAALIIGVLNRRGISAIKQATDGMKDELVAATAVGSRAAGHAQGETKGHAAGLKQGRHEERPQPSE